VSDKKDDEEFWLPDHELEALARCFLPYLRKFYEDPANMERFKEWQAGRQKPSKNG